MIHTIMEVQWTPEELDMIPTIIQDHQWTTTNTVRRMEVGPWTMQDMNRTTLTMSIQGERDRTTEEQTPIIQITTQLKSLKPHCLWLFRVCFFEQSFFVIFLLNSKRQKIGFLGKMRDPQKIWYFSFLQKFFVAQNLIAIAFF